MFFFIFVCVLFNKVKYFRSNNKTGLGLPKMLHTFSINEISVDKFVLKRGSIDTNSLIKCLIVKLLFSSDFE